MARYWKNSQSYSKGIILSNLEAAHKNLVSASQGKLALLSLEVHFSCLAFSNMFSSAISEMYSREEKDAPPSNAFLEIAKHCMEIFRGFVLAKEHCFETIIFGFCPLTESPFAFHLALRPGQGNRVWDLTGVVAQP